MEREIQVLIAYVFQNINESVQLFQTFYAVKKNIIVIVRVFQRLSKHFTIKVLSSWERTVEVCSICFGEVPCILWVSDTKMTGLFDDIEFVDEAVIQTI